MGLPTFYKVATFFVAIILLTVVVEIQQKRKFSFRHFNYIEDSLYSESVHNTERDKYKRYRLQSAKPNIK